MAGLDTEITAFEAARPELEAEFKGRWVIFHDGRLVGDFDSFDAAANHAVSAFGRGPYLIRQVGAPALTLPASAMYVFTDA